ncbi:TonB-dependent receptor [Pseudoalteromonas sp. MMG010]|uniref:TonB-dependent receptor n=1 Tax=Pseudoalteromonas sp. MMG010 TaxID=2822685 RepID=UPI001B3A71F8|nr:TonB-dependent receptor [Pseudoalteromonas sp. MMG010]MBQ4833570.1 TonB-dependent receptor [Pseudoalteromonas sp. MMG010]
MLHKPSRTLLATAIISSFGLTGTVYAEQGAQPKIEEIVVQGYRNSLLKAKDLKRNAVGSQDSIVAEDIADFPDLNLADSLQRVPGIAITREGGEGRQISLRGLGANFTQVQLNGMEALGTSSSAMDSRGSVSRSRAFDFNIFASELFQRVDVKKSFSAEMDEGGIGGTVGLHTAKPFDFDGFNTAVSAQLGDNSQTDDISPRVAVLISNTWDDKFGALFSVAYSKRDVNEQGYNTYRWRKKNASGSDISQLSDELQNKINNEEVSFSRGSRYSLFENEQERLGTTLSLQYRPTNNLELGFDALYGELNNDRSEYHLQNRGSSSTAIGCTGPAYNDAPICSTLTELELNENNDAIYSVFENAAIHSESRNQYANTKISQFVFNTDWQISDDFNMTALVGRAKTQFDTASVKIYLETFGNETIDYRDDAYYGQNTYGFDPTDSSLFRYHEIDLSKEEITNTFDSIKLDFNYILNDVANIKFGLSNKHFESENGEIKSDNINRSDWENGVLDDTVDASLTFTNTAHNKLQWVSVDVPGTLASMNINPELDNPDFTDNVQEKTFAAYLQYEAQWELGSGYLLGNVGVRHYDTTTNAIGLINAQVVNVENAYSGLLPAINLAWDSNDSLVLRASYGENLTRPSLGALVPTGVVQNDATSTNGLSISSGNPNLKPYESVNFDLSVEYYFENIGYAAVSYFHKSIDNFIITETYDIPYSQTGYPESFLGDVDENGNPQTADTIFTVIQPQNLDESDISGWELAFQRDFDFLPAPFNNLGIIANYTFADGEALYRNVGNSGVDQYKSFPGLSEHSGNFTVYYDSDTWGARIATAYRSDYIASVQAGNGDEDENGFHASTYIDASAFYQVNEKLKLTIEASNLTNEREEQYSDSSDRLYNTTVNGRTIYLGASYRF